jgi:two-component system sensor histidine kinase PilS (NtrC family)
LPGQHNRARFIVVNALYVFLSLALELSNHNRWPEFEKQVFALVLIGVRTMTLLMHASGGMHSGSGMLLISTMAGAGLLASEYFALGAAAMGALALLGAEVNAHLRSSFEQTAYTQTEPLGA